jgi:hypothetical protein
VAASALGLCGLQILSGALVVWTQLGLFSTLAHAGIMALLFAALAHLVRAGLKAADGNKVGARLSRLSDDAGAHLAAAPGREKFATLTSSAKTSAPLSLPTAVSQPPTEQVCVEWRGGRSGVSEHPGVG